jgi:glycosyltransferase involved in cell wall biosynthesis
MSAAPAVFQPTPSWEGIWIVIPAYNEEQTIRGLAEASLRLGARVLVVDDGSSDATAARVDDLPLTLIRHAGNRGKAASLRTAFTHALAQGADAVVTIDGDGQHDPVDATALVREWQARPECIAIGARLHDAAAIPRARYLANRFACFWISWAAGHRIADSQSGFRVYSSEVMAIALGDGVSGDRFAFESEILIEAAWRGHPTRSVKMAARYPAGARASHYRAAVDTAKIVVMVGGRLLRRRLHLRGLWSSLRSGPGSGPVPRPMPPRRSRSVTPE